ACGGEHDGGHACHRDGPGKTSLGGTARQGQAGPTRDQSCPASGRPAGRASPPRVGAKGGVEGRKACHASGGGCTRDDGSPKAAGEARTAAPGRAAATDAASSSS